MGVSMKFITEKQIKLKIKNIVQSLNLPCVAMFCTHLDRYRKPSIGMFEFYKTRINRTKIDLKNSFFVGDAMGRPKDHSAADLLFAYNCKLPFVPIEGFLSGFEKPKLYTIDQLAKYRIPKYPNSKHQTPPRILAKQSKAGSHGDDLEFCFIYELTNAIEKFVRENSKSIVILLIGLTGCGKTFFYERYLYEFDYKRIDDDGNKSFDQQIDDFNSYVQDDEIIDKRIVIDQKNLTEKDRKRWIDLAKREGYEVFAIKFNVSIEQCLHLARFRNFYIQNNYKAPSQTDLMKQQFNLIEPRYDEGFRTIYVLDFFENFNDSSSSKNYQQYYYHFLFDKP